MSTLQKKQEKICFINSNFSFGPHSHCFKKIEILYAYPGNTAPYKTKSDNRINKLAHLHS